MIDAATLPDRQLEDGARRAYGAGPEPSQSQDVVLDLGQLDDARQLAAAARHAVLKRNAA